MQDPETYTYTVRAIVPEMSADNLAIVADTILDDTSLDNRGVITASDGDRITITVSEITTDPMEHFSSVLFLAKSGLAEVGIHPRIC